MILFHNVIETIDIGGVEVHRMVTVSKGPHGNAIIFNFSSIHALTGEVVSPPQSFALSTNAVKNNFPGVLDNVITQIKKDQEDLMTWSDEYY